MIIPVFEVKAEVSLHRCPVTRGCAKVIDKVMKQIKDHKMELERFVAQRRDPATQKVMAIYKPLTVKVRKNCKSVKASMWVGLAIME